MGKDMGVTLQTLIDTHEQHYQAAKKQEKDPEGGPFPAYPSGKTWDEPSGKTGSGKKFFHNIIPGSAVPTEPFYVAIITPVIHYCMGGLQCTVDAECIDARGQVIPGLYVAGEAAGGIHGNNRLGGNSCSTALSLAVWLARLPASTSSALATSSSYAQPLESSRNSPSEQEPKRTQSSLCSHGVLYMKLRQA